MNGLDLFSGIGGLAAALDEWVKPIAYCENVGSIYAWLTVLVAVGAILYALHLVER